MKVSKRLLNVPASPIRKLVPFAQATKEKGIDVIHLNIGDPDIKSPAVMIESIKKININPIPYGGSQGITQLVDAIKRYYHKLGYSFIENNRIQITIGGSEAILMAILAITDPGDEVAVFEPTYPNYLSFAAVAGIKLIPVTTSLKRAFHLPDKREIEKKITRKTKAILICSPNNPTGTVYSKEEIEMLVDVAKRKNIFLISDEVYREFVYDGLKHISLADYMPQFPKQIVLLDSLSKRYSLCGLRLGALISLNDDLMDGVLRIAQGRLSAGYLDQMIASKLNHVPEKYFRKNIKEYQSRRNFLLQGLKQIKGVSAYRPEGAFYLMAGLPIADAEDFCRWLLTDFQKEKQTVMFAPGQGFYITPGLGKNEVRIAYVLNKEKLKKAVEILDEGLRIYNHKITNHK